MILLHDDRHYEVGSLVGETDYSRIYSCKIDSDHTSGLLVITTDAMHNGRLDKAAFVLGKLGEASPVYEAEYAKLGSGKLLGYDRLFPCLVDNFVASQQGGRRVNVLKFIDVESPSALAPLSNIRNRDHLMVALSSSAWIMGRLLKLLVFAHDLGISVRSMTANNIMIEPNQHFAIVFDWSNAIVHGGQVPTQESRIDLSLAAQAVFGAIDGDLRDGSCPQTDEKTKPYVRFLWELARGSHTEALLAHQSFYELVGEIFGFGFNPLKTLPLVR